MFMLLVISIIRYGTVLPTNKTKKYFQQHSFISAVICWLIALIFALSPLFNWNKYLPEGLGFHCGLNWSDRSISSRLYLILAFSFVYFIPLILLSTVTIYIYCVIRHLHQVLRMNRQQPFNKLSRKNRLLVKKRSLPPLNSSSDSNTTKSNKFVEVKLSKFPTVDKHVRSAPVTYPLQICYAMRLHRLN
ncbi:unnamed protein product [Rotaria magnacalcarata]|nr:unnamed protein product [Rotaria magnacalcarata]